MTNDGDSDYAVPGALLASLRSSSDAWSRFDLDSRRAPWDSTASQCRAARESSVVARRALAEITNKFKRVVKRTESGSSSSDMVSSLTKECRVIVKAYQEEIDSLTRRSKASEQAFLSSYQSLFELPDPALVLGPVLEFVLRREEELRRLEEELESGRVRCEDVMRELEQVKSDLTETEQRQQQQQQQSDNGNDASLQSEVLSLRREVSEYEAEFKTLKNQDITIRKLEAKIEHLQDTTQREIDLSLKKSQEQILEQEGRRTAEALEREAALERRLATLELELRAERAGRRALEQRDFEYGEGEQEREAAWEAQRRILVDDGERLREMLHDVSQERDACRLKLGAVGNNNSTNDDNTAHDDNVGDAYDHDTLHDTNHHHNSATMMAERRAYEAEVSEMALTLFSLREELHHNKETAAQERTTLQTTVDDLQHERSGLSATVANLRAKLDAAPVRAEVDDMRRELALLKRLEYNADEDDDDNGEDEDRHNPEMTAKSSEDLESVLVSRLRKMDADLLKERRAKQEAEEDRRALQAIVLDLELKSQKADTLVASLESDLSKAIASTACGVAVGSASSSTSPLVSNSTESSTLQRIIDPDAAEASSAQQQQQQQSSRQPRPSLSQQSSSIQDDSVTTIIMAQRDRLQARCDRLEAERDSFKYELQAQVQISDNFKADSTKLYEKVRYLQNYQGRGASNSNPSSSSSMTLRPNAMDLDLEALEERYEASVDPFRQFSRQERQRKLKEMSLLERIVFFSSKIVLANTKMRTGLFFYVAGMHLLVFVTTYHWAHEAGCHSHLEDHPGLAHLHHGVPLDESAVGVLARNNILQP